MDKNLNDLVTDYEIDASYIAKLQSELHEAQERARTTLEALMSAHGKGPYNVNGNNVVVLRRKGTMCTMPAVRVRKNKRNTNVNADTDINTVDNDAQVD